MKSKTIKITLCLILLAVICGAWYLTRHNNDLSMVPSNVTQAIISYDDDRFKEAHDAFYFEDKKIRSLRDTYYEDEKIKGYYYYNAHGVVDIHIVHREDMIDIEESTKEKFDERTNALKNTFRNKKSKYEIIIYKKNLAPEKIKQWICSIKTSDDSLNIIEYNGKLFGYCQSPNGFGYSYDKTSKSNSLSVFENPYDDMKDDFVLFSIPCKEYTYVELE